MLSLSLLLVGDIRLLFAPVAGGQYPRGLKSWGSLRLQVGEGNGRYEETPALLSAIFSCIGGDVRRLAVRHHNRMWEAERHRVGAGATSTDGSCFKWTRM